MAEEPISLYIQLEQGEKANLEVIARASLAFAAAIKDVVYVLDPSLDIRIDLASGTEGSLSLNSIIKTVKTAYASEDLTLKVVTIVVLCWFGEQVAEWGVHKLMDTLVGPAEHTLSEADLAKLAELVAKQIENAQAKRHVEQVYRELERDTAISGVGATRAPAERPKTIVPRAEFSQRGGTTTTTEITVEKRIRTSPERVTLISPVLLPGPRRWRFSFHEGEFGASIEDAVFLDSLLTGKLTVPMIGGIEMDVVLQTTEEKEMNVWVVKERKVLHVSRIYPAPTQPALTLPPPPEVKREDGE